jgi:hypothetical protein
MLEMRIIMRQSKNYTDVRRFFEGNSEGGFMHIRAWIVSPMFYTTYFKDKEKRPGSVIRLRPIEEYVQVIEGVDHTIKGYKLIISDGFDEEYGVCSIADRRLGDVAKKLLLHNVSKDYNLIPKK